MMKAPSEEIPGALPFRSGDSVMLQDIRIGCLKTSE